MPYQAALLTFLGVLCLVVFVSCLRNLVSEKEANDSAQNIKVPEQKPFWARRKSSANQSAIYMQTWDLEKNSFEYELSGGISKSGLKSSLSTKPCQDDPKLDFRAAIDSVMLAHKKANDNVVNERCQEKHTQIRLDIPEQKPYTLVMQQMEELFETKNTTHLKV
jgi:hypothetical protein